MKYLVSVEESIRDILLTPIGSRVMLPEYGSRIFELIDKRVDDAFRANLAYYVIEAAERWEKRVQIDRVILNSLKDGVLDFSIKLKNGSEIRIKNA